MTLPQPLLTTAKGGKMMDNITRKQPMISVLKLQKIRLYPFEVLFYI